MWWTSRLKSLSPFLRSSGCPADWFPSEAGLPLLELSTGLSLFQEQSRGRCQGTTVDAWDSVLLWVSCMVFFQPLFRSSLFWELTCASLIVPCRTHPPAPGNAAAPERLEALKYQRIKKPKKSSKGSSKSKKRSGKWRILSFPLSPPILWDCLVQDPVFGFSLELNAPAYVIVSF